MMTAAKDILLGIDFGTGGCKVTAIDCCGNLAGENSVEYPTEFAHPGWSEQNPCDWYSAMCQALKNLQQNGLDLTACEELFVTASPADFGLAAENGEFTICSGKRIGGVARYQGDFV